MAGNDKGTRHETTLADPRDDFQVRMIAVMIRLACVMRVSAGWPRKFRPALPLTLAKSRSTCGGTLSVAR
jgi:hypothetical protein